MDCADDVCEGEVVRGALNTFCALCRFSSVLTSNTVSAQQTLDLLCSY
jgi:hypothetical protein